MTPARVPARATVLVGMSIAEVNRRAERDATLAFLQQGDPALSAELTRLADAGAESVVLVGVVLEASGPALSWLRRVAAHWWREYTGRRPELLVATRLARSADEVAAVAADLRPVHGEEAGLTSPAWESVPHHHHQVMVCRGPRCSAQGAAEGLRALNLALAEHELGDDDVLVTTTGCQFPCNQAPVVSVQPDDVWYGRVDAATARAIVTEHLVGGLVVETHRLSR